MLASLALVLFSAADPHAQYPLLHIGAKLNCSADGPCTKDDGADGNGKDYPFALTEADATALGAFSLIHMSPRRAAEVEKVHVVSKSPIVKYVESVPVCGGSGGQVTPYVVSCNDTHNFETGGYRKDARVYFAGNLTKGITEKATQLHLCLGVPFCCKRYATPLEPSTQKHGNYSTYTGKAYVTFLRIHNELMKIEATDTYPNPDPKLAALGAQCQRLTVVRGLDGSTPRAAEAGAAVLAPVMVKPVTWGTGPEASGHLPYQAEYSSEYAWASLANFTVDAVVQLGYDGAWFDSYSPNVNKDGADGGGLKVAVWNVAEGRPYTPREAMDSQKARLQKVWTYTKQQLGRYPTIWANNFEAWAPATKVGRHGTVTTPGDVELMVVSEGFRPFDGCSLEAWTGAAMTVEGKAAGCWAQRGNISDLMFRFTEQWASRCNTMIDAARKNLAVAAMTESAGCQSPMQTYWPAKVRTQIDLLHYASYLLTVMQKGGSGVQGGGVPLLGTSAFFANDTSGDGQPRGMSYAKLWEPYAWDLGAPATVPTSVADFAVPGVPTIYLRYFANAAVAVNPGPDGASSLVRLQHGPYTNKLTGERGITSVLLPAHTGCILLLE